MALTADQHLKQRIAELLFEVAQLRAHIDKLTEENMDLRARADGKAAKADKPASPARLPA